MNVQKRYSVMRAKNFFFISIIDLFKKRAFQKGKTVRGHPGSRLSAFSAIAYFNLRLRSLPRTGIRLTEMYRDSQSPITL